MHELPIAENIKNLAVKHAEQANAEKITDIFLVIGQLSSVVDESIQFYADNRLDHADACRLAELSPAAFNSELAGRGIGIPQYPSTESPRARRAAS